MAIPELHIGHSKFPEGKEIIVKNAVYESETRLERSFPHRHSFYVICLIRKGSGIHVIDFEEFEVKQNRLFIINPYQVHFWMLNANTNISMVQFSESILHFDNEPVSNLLTAFGHKNNYLDITNFQSIEILELATKLEQESSAADKHSTDIMRSYLVILCKLIERMACTSGNPGIINHKEEKIQKFMFLINKHYVGQKSVSYYAGELNITANYLNMLSKKHLGKNAGEMITSRIMLEAKRLLYHTKSDISWIAFELGYEDPSYFTRAFRRFEKKTPTEFRDEIYKKYQHRNN